MNNAGEKYTPEHRCATILNAQIPHHPTKKRGMAAKNSTSVPTGHSYLVLVTFHLPSCRRIATLVVVVGISLATRNTQSVRTGGIIIVYLVDIHCHVVVIALHHRRILLMFQAPCSSRYRPSHKKEPSHETY